ncbi:MAG: hypothetical protein IPJ54_07675 [Saprospiraceae bacterium]|nr:hypothetical protein [Saprospiraceae bacterium]
MKTILSFFLSFFLSVVSVFGQLIPTPQICIDNWDPSPCQSCVVSCDVCTFYFYCGVANDAHPEWNSECNIYVRCSEESYIKMYDQNNSSNIFGASWIGPCISVPTNCPTYPGNAFGPPPSYNFAGNVVLEVYTPDGSKLLCSTTYNFNCY